MLVVGLVFCFLGVRGQMLAMTTLMPTHKKLAIDLLALVSEACR